MTSETEVNIEEGSMKINLQNEYPDLEIRYTLNDEPVTRDSEIYTEPIEVSETTTVKAAVFENGEMPGEVFEKTFYFHKAVGKPVAYDPIYHDSYQGAKEVGMVNVLRGTLNFHDGQWQAWLVDDMELVIDLEETVPVSKVMIGSMENQGSGIYFPLEVEVMVSRDGEKYSGVGKIEREFENNGNPVLKDFSIEFQPQQVRYIKVMAKNLGHPPTGGDAWLFIDEIVVE